MVAVISPEARVAPKKKSTRPIVIAAVVVAVLAVVVLVTTLLDRSDGQTPVTPEQGGANAVALQRAVADSSNPSIASIAGGWGYSCNGQALMVVVQLDGSALYSPNRQSVLLQVEEQGGSTVAVVRSSDDAGTVVGTTMTLWVQGGRLQVAHGGTTDSLLPIDVEEYGGGPLC